jgi:hypothetical protein
MLISQLAQKCFSIFLLRLSVSLFVIPSGICCCRCLSRRRLSSPSPVLAIACPRRCLFLPLHVPAVILTLSEVEWGRIPKNSTSQNHPYLSTHTFSVFAVACPLQPQNKNRHFDRSGSRICEQRSGDIRFFT